MMNLDVYLLYMMYSCRRQVTKKVVPYMEMPLNFYKKKMSHHRREKHQSGYLISKDALKIQPSYQNSSSRLIKNRLNARADGHRLLYTQQHKNRER